MNKIDERSLKVIDAQDRFGGGGGEPPMSTLDYRISRLEEDVSMIKAEVRGIREAMSDLRVELHKSLNTQTKWIVGFMVAIASVTLAIARFLF